MVDERSLQEAFEPLIGSPAWGVRRGYGSFITLEFGSPLLIVRQPIVASASASIKTKAALGRRRISVAGEHHFWVYCSKWQIYFHSKIISTNESSKKIIDKACFEIDGRILQRVDRLVNSGGIVCRFEDDLLLEISPDSDLRDDQCMIYHKDKVYSLSYAGLLNCERRTGS